MIPEFLNDREIFVTGGSAQLENFKISSAAFKNVVSGVVGKALLDKLLRSCNVRKVYVLLRPKRNVTIEQRLEKIKQAMIFRRLRTEKPNEFDEKVVPIPGDVELPMLGITSGYAKLMENVSIVFHSAATVRFDEPLKDAIRLNVGGTLETLTFAETLKHLEVFMHVSTFFSNPYLEFVEAKWYEAPMDWKFCLDLSRRNDIPEELLDAITKKLIIGFPNTYTFTKNLAESLVNDYRTKLPVAIFRPSIVVFAIDDPEPGFPPSLMGAMGLFAVAGAGVLKTIQINKDQRLDLSPQDIAIKGLLYYAMKSANMYAKDRPDEIPVFHTSSCTHSTTSFPEYIDIMQDHKFWIDIALEKNLLIPGLICTEYELVYMFVVIFKQLLPALLVDLLLVMSGRKPELMKVQRKVFTTLHVMKPFMFNNYGSSGLSYCGDMLRDLNGTDFHIDAMRISTSYYGNVGFCQNMVYKVREVLFKEDPSTMPRSRMIVKAKIILYRAAQIFLAYKLYHRLVSPMISNWNWNETSNEM